MTRRRIIVIDAKGAVHGHSTDLPPLRPGDSVRAIMREDGGFDVVPLRQAAGDSDEDGIMVEVPTGALFIGAMPLWFDAPEQENDR